MSKLHKKFLGYFLVLGIVPVIIISITTVSAAYFLHKRDVRLIEENLITQKSVEISKFIGNFISQLQIIVGYEDYVQPKISNQKFLLDEIVKVNPNVNWVSFVCVVENSCAIGMETAKLSAALKDIKPENRINDPAFTSARNGEIYLSEVDYSENFNSMTIAAPVKNKNNQIIGALMANFKLSQIESIIKNSTLGETGYLYLIDSDGKIIANSLGAADFSPASPDKVLMASKNLANLNWKLIAEWPLKEVYEIIGDIIRKTAIIIIIVSFLVFFLSYFVAGGLLNPIKKLVQGAKIIGEGNLEHKVNIKTDDEVQDLADQFNKMTTDLKEIESLSRALKKEKELSYIKSRFLTTVSHQLNTPITEINWALQSINFDNIENLKLALASIKEGSKNISDIVNDVLFLSDIGFDYKPKTAEKIKLSELLDGIIVKYNPQISEKNIRVNFSKDNDLEINGSRQTIGKLFDTLISNAIIYNKQNGEITTGVERQESGDGVLISVKDTGIGIPKDDQQFIFKEIFRAKNAPSGKNVSTGMGLLIAKIITDGHNGKIWFESKENEGATFYVQLPNA